MSKQCQMEVGQQASRDRDAVSRHNQAKAIHQFKSVNATILKFKRDWDAASQDNNTKVDNTSSRDPQNSRHCVSQLVHHLNQVLHWKSSSDPAYATKTTNMKMSMEPAEFYNAAMLTQAGSKGPQINLKFKIWFQVQWIISATNVSW